MSLHVVLLLLLPLLSSGKVTSFDRCKQFFANGAPPTVLADSSDNNRFRQLCQCLLDQNGRPRYFYATLYDTANKIPVYSAYVFFKRADIDREDRWYVEPQLDGGKRICMGGLNHIPASNRGRHQALGRDYEGSGYDKGHLFPVLHTVTEAAMLATSTLTNAAPQDAGFNRGQWRKHEEDLAEHLEATCRKAHVVTGVVPGKQLIGGGVRVAKFYWTAYCCRGKRGATLSAGFLGPDNNGKVQSFTVKDLESTLSGAAYYDSDFSVFGGKC